MASPTCFEHFTSAALLVERSKYALNRPVAFHLQVFAVIGPEDVRKCVSLGVHDVGTEDV